MPKMSIQMKDYAAADGVSLLLQNEAESPSEAVGTFKSTFNRAFASRF